MNARLAALAEQLRLNTLLFGRCLEDVDDTTARTRPNEKTNNPVFVALHLVHARCWLAQRIGIRVDDPFTHLRDVNRVEDLTDPPTLETLRDLWAEVSPALAAKFGQLGDPDLMRPSPGTLPGVQPTLLGDLAFLLMHEAYHIGQLGLLRRYFGLGPMTYGE